MTIKAWIPGQPEQVSIAQQGFVTQAATAGGTNQATATVVPTDFVVFTTVPSGSGTKLLGGSDTPSTPGPCQPADTQIIVNHGANALAVYPQLGGSIANGAVNAALSVPATKTASFFYLGSGNWGGSVSA